MMEGVKVSARARPTAFFNDPYVMPDDKVYVVDNKSIQRYNSLIDLLSRVYNLKFGYDDMGQMTIDMRTGPISFMLKADPVIIIDGSVSTMNMLNHLTVEQVEAIAVNKWGNPRLGAKGAGGSIAIKTRKTTEDLIDKAESTVVKQILVRGYSNPARYYTPKYNIDPQNSLYVQYASIH